FSSIINFYFFRFLIFLAIDNNKKGSTTNFIKIENITNRVNNHLNKTSTLQTNNKSFCDKYCYYKKLGIGINVNWLTFAWVNNYYFYWKERNVSIPSIFKEHFNSIRLRINYDTIEKKTKFEQLKEIVDDCLKENLTVVISLSGLLLNNDPTKENALKMTNYRLKIANEFKNYSYLLSYDLITETGGKLKGKPEILSFYFNKTINEIRRIDKRRILFVSVPNRRKVDFFKLNLSLDNFTLIEIHVLAGGPKEDYEDYLIDYFKKIKEVENKTKTPIWFGAVRFNKIIKKNKTFYYNLSFEKEFALFFCRLSRRNNIPFAVNADTIYFDYKNLKWKNRTNYLKECVKIYKNLSLAN
ncbi:MAG: hypothetical protein ABGW69_03640, partial [Nanoarchaeota archaeon]